MNVLVIQPWIKNGGAELISLQLAYNLESRGEKAVIACLFLDKKGLPDVYKKVRFLLPPRWVQKATKGSRVAFFVLGPVFLTKIVWENADNFDILNPHNFPSLWISAVVAKLKKKLLVWSCNEPPLRPPLSDIWKIGILDYLGWLFASSCLDKLIVKKFVKNIMVLDDKNQRKVREIYKLPSTVNYIGVDFDLYSKGDGRKIIERHNLKGKFVLFYPAKLHPQKNQELCIRAFTKVVREIPNSVLVLGGEGESREFLEDLADKLNVSDRVIFAGFLTPRQVADWFAATDLVLFPPKGHQSWGLVPIEALCAGKLSVVSSYCGVSEFLAEKDISIVKKPDSESFSKGILEFYHHSEKYRLFAQKGMSYVRKKLSWEAYTDRCFNYFLHI